jgi:hypothetical protein
MQARMDKQRDDLNENIRNNKNLADNADKDLDNRIKSTNEVVQKNKDKQMADHTLSLKNIGDLDTKTANHNKVTSDNTQTNKQLENCDMNLKGMIKDANDRNAKLREYCNETFTIISI